MTTPDLEQEQRERRTQKARSIKFDIPTCPRCGARVGPGAGVCPRRGGSTDPA